MDTSSKSVITLSYKKIAEMNKVHAAEIPEHQTRNRHLPGQTQVFFLIQEDRYKVQHIFERCTL